jgi:hypothetical protein
LTEAEVFRLWKSIAGDEAAAPWDEDRAFGFFQGFRPHGNGLDSALLPLPGGAQVLERLLRWSGGLQATYNIVGLEMGYSRELKKDDRPGVSAFQMAPFLTLGVFSASVRYTFPLSREVRRQRPGGADVAYVLTLKLPLPLGKLSNTR